MSFSETMQKECLRRVSFPPPVYLVETFFSLLSPAAGMAQNAGLPSHFSEPRGPADRPFRVLFFLCRAPFSEATEPRPFWYGC